MHTYIHASHFFLLTQACSGAGEWRAALSILDDIASQGLKPESAAYVAAMEACARGGVMDLALELLDRVLQEHPGDDAVRNACHMTTSSTQLVLMFPSEAISACFRKWVWSDCHQFFEAEGSATPLDPRVSPKQTITAGYRGAIRATGNGGQWEEATSLLRRMRQDPSALVTTEDYNAAILACVRAQQSVAALTLLGDMTVETTRCRADETSYVLVMRAFGREGRSVNCPWHDLVRNKRLPTSLRKGMVRFMSPMSHAC